MPLYEYECACCGERFERIQKFSDPPEAACPKCGGPAERRLSPPAIQFKGTGWYVTDYARKSSPADRNADPHSGKTETATQTKPEAEKSVANAKSSAEKKSSSAD